MSAHRDPADSAEDHEKPIGTIFVVTLFLVASIAMWAFVYYLVVHRS
jgi:hypothetical protein